MREDMKQIFTWLVKNNLTAPCRDFWNTSYENSSQQTQDTLHLISSNDKILQYSHAAQDIYWTSDDWEQEKATRTENLMKIFQVKMRKL